MKSAFLRLEGNTFSFREYQNYSPTLPDNLIQPKDESKFKSTVEPLYAYYSQGLFEEYLIGFNGCFLLKQEEAANEHDPGG
jgi:hypothetical protein